MIKLNYDKPLPLDAIRTHNPLDIYADMSRLGLYPVGLPYLDGWNWVQDFVKIEENRDE